MLHSIFTGRSGGEETSASGRVTIKASGTACLVLCCRAASAGNRQLCKSPTFWLLLQVTGTLRRVFACRIRYSYIIVANATVDKTLYRQICSEFDLFSRVDEIIVSS